MKVLTATTETQGWNGDDYCSAIEGELVHFPPINCSRDPESECECLRSLVGMSSAQTTTTAKVVERPDMTKQIFRELLATALEERGFVIKKWAKDSHEWGWFDEMAEELLYAAEQLPIGTIVERRAYRFLVRRYPDHVEI